MAELLYKDEVYAVIGAAMEVYNQLGPGFGESIYQEAMEIELDSRKLPNQPQRDIYVKYKGIKTNGSYSTKTQSNSQSHYFPALTTRQRPKTH